ncbi:MAG: hypothetical protein Q8S84_03330 [bacterium]|nr:hypothetical protein [bacterium]MDP3380557.1 hypothetical protein [bacterium]
MFIKTFISKISQELYDSNDKSCNFKSEKILSSWNINSYILLTSISISNNSSLDIFLNHIHLFS